MKQTYAANFQLTGSVQTNSAVAISGATVDIYTPGTTTDVVSPTTTDQSGDYSFSSVPEGTYDIKVTPPSGSGFTSAIALSQTISSDTIINFILTPTGTVTISGHVLDAFGNAVPNQIVALENSNHQITVSTTTDSSGYYSLQSSGGSFLFIQHTTGGNNPSLNVPLLYNLTIPYNLTQDTILNISLPVKRVDVHIQDFNGVAVSNTRLTTAPSYSSSINSGGLNIGSGITNATGGSSYNTGFSTAPPTTDANGNVTLWLFPTNLSNSYSFTATPPSGSNSVTTTVSNITITNNTSQTITLKQPVTISGHVLDAFGNAVPNQIVALENSSQQQIASTTTDSSGFYSLQSAGGQSFLFLQHTIGGNNPSLNVPLLYNLTIPYNLTQNSTLDITIPVKKVIVHVQAQASGQALSGIKITSSPAYSTSINSGGLNIGSGITNATGGSSYSTGFSTAPPLTDSSGNVTLWLFQNDTHHTYSFTATPPSGSNLPQTTISNITISDGVQETINIPVPITISGHVLDPLGNAVPNQIVALENSSQQQIASTTTDSSGFYSLQSTGGQSYLFLQHTTGGNDPTLNVPLLYNLSIPYNLTQDTSLDVTIPEKKVSVHVQDVNGNPVSNIRLTTSPSYSSYINSGGLNIGSGITNASGGSSYNTGFSVPPQSTDSQGNATLWLFPNDSHNTYTFTATPPNGSIYGIFTLNNISVTGNQTEIISLQYNHATPVTTADLETQNTDGMTYSNPTTVTLTASAAAGYNLQSPGGTFYTIDGGQTLNYSAPFTVTGNGSHTIAYWSVDNSGVPETHHSQTFTIASYTLSGTVYVDTNQNGVQDGGEQGYQGTTITLSSGQFSTTATSGNDGSYAFTGLQPGTYTETLTLPNGYAATTSNPVTIGLNTDTTQNFGIAQANSLVTAINAGGDTQGNFVSDTDFSGGSQYSSSASVDTSGVSNPAPEAVYQTVRFGNSFSYTIPNLTANGTYTVRLHFNEVYWGTSLAGNSGGIGSRVFNVTINGTQELSNYDIYDKAGGANKAVVEQLPATADANGNITINFTTVTDNALVNGIEIYNGTLPSPSPTPTPTPASSALINAGGNAIGTFATDNSYSGGSTYSSTASVDTSSVTNPAPEAVYQSVRYGNFTYNVSNLSPSTNYLVRLHFNELYHNSAGSRVFNVSINGTQVLSNFDIFAAAGGQNKALIEDFVVSTNAQGKYAIQFSTVTDNAMVNGIEIIPPTIPARTYYTANDGANFTRSTTPFTTGVATQTVNNDGSITMNANNPSGYVDSGFVLYEGTLGSLQNFTTVGNGNQYSLNLWFDANNDNEYFAWDPNGILTSLNGDTYALGNGSQNGNEYINGQSQFFLLSDGQDHTLSDFKNGNVSGINANTKVAVWFGVNTSNGSSSSTLQAIEGL